MKKKTIIGTVIVAIIILVLIEGFTLIKFFNLEKDNLKFSFIFLSLKFD